MTEEKQDMLLTHDEVKMLAWEKCPALYAYIKIFEIGQCTWEQAMQGAAIHLARETERHRVELLRCFERMPPAPLMTHNA